MDEGLEPELQIAVTREGDVAIVAVHGELDAASTSTLQARLDAEVRAGRSLVLDLLACEFVDSTGLHAIIDVRAAVEDSGGRFAVACLPDGPVARVIDVALPGMLETHASRAAAVAAVG